MRLTTVILIASFLQVSAATFGQRITIDQKNTPVESVLKEIRKQSGFDFFYDGKIIAKNLKVNISVTNASITDALDHVFNGLPYKYAIDGKTILITKKQNTNLDNLASVKANIDVKGRVLDEKKNPLPGATIKVKGSNQSVTTNDNGEFLLKDVDENAILIIAYIGYIQKEIKVSKDMGDISMSLSENNLQEVNIAVSNGYQTISKERATGAFNVVGKEQLEKPTTNIAQRLIGTTAGMQATLDADGNPRFEIRGQTSLNVRDGNNRLLPTAAPLVVVDGFAIQGTISDINPNDIESITVLKDAAAASIWGAKSANGVIVIVTKKGKKGTPLKVSFSAFARMGTKIDLDYVNPRASSAEAVDFEKRAYGNWGATVNSGALSASAINNKGRSAAFTAMNEYALGKITLEQRDALLNQYSNQSNKSQIEDELLENPLTQQYNLNLSSGSEKMSNSLSLLYEDSQSNFKYTNGKKYTFNYRTDADIFKWLQFNFSGMVNYSKNNNNGVGFATIQGIDPYQMLKNEDGSFTNLSTYYKPTLTRLVPTALFPYADWGSNPVQEIENRKFTAEGFNTRLQAGLRFKLLKGLTFDSKVQYELFNSTNKYYNNENTYEVRNTVNIATTWNQTTNAMILNLPKGGMLDQDGSKMHSYNFRNQLNFDRKFGDKHELTVVAGTESSSIVTDGYNNARVYGYNDQTLTIGTLPNGPGTTAQPIKNWLGATINFPYTGSYSYTTERYFSLFGNAAYTFDDRYTLSGSVRTDASNLITDDPSFRYSPFWSVGLGWQLSKEEFIKKISWIDRLSLRATYGYNGNVDRSTSFMPLLNQQANPNVYTGDRTASISSYGNPTLRWEKTGTWNVGADFSFLNGAISGKVDLYNKSGKDLIAQLTIPSINGAKAQKLNNAAMTNRGIEMELGTFQKLKGSNITWRGSLNFAYNDNKITKLFVSTYDANTLAQGGTGSYVEGANASDIWRYQYAGLINGQPMIAGVNGTNYALAAFLPGDGRTFMQNVGTTVAPYTLGFINNFQIYDFNLSFIITGKFGHVFQRTGFNYSGSGGLPNNKLSEVINGDPMLIVPLPQNILEPNYPLWPNFTPSMSYLIESASHIRMQEVNLSYNLPSRFTSKLKMSRLQVFAQGNNLFTITSNGVGEDPEYPIGTLKPSPRISLGLKCEF